MEEDLFPHILMDKETLLMFSRYDIDLIIGVIEKYTQRKIFASKDTKDVRAAKIAFLFGSGKLLYSKPKVVPLLKTLHKTLWKHSHLQFFRVFMQVSYTWKTRNLGI